MTRAGMRWLVVGACWLPAGCGSNGASDVSPTAVVTTSNPSPATTVPASTDPPPTAPPVSSTTTTATTTTTTTTTAPAPSTTVSPEDELVALYESATPAVADHATCDIGWSDLAADAGEVTFARGGDVFSFDPTSGALRCLASVDRDPSTLDWNPAGDRLLVDEDLVVTATGQHASGFALGTAGISWSKPKGSALIAPSPDGTVLRHIDATDPSDETDVSSLATTWAAAYHPSGLAIVSAGVDGNGVAGLFLADNQGNDAKTLVFLEDTATTISAVAFAPDGESVVFVHDHTNGTTDDGAVAHVHRISVRELVLSDVVSLPDVVPAGLVASEQSDGTIAWQQAYSGTDVVTVRVSAGVLRPIGFPSTVAEPVGFFDGGTTAAVVSANDGGDDGGQLWVFPPDGDPQLIARNVTAATTRTVHDRGWSDPPIRIDQEAVG